MDNRLMQVQVCLFVCLVLNEASTLLGEHSAILLTFIKLPFVIKIFVLSFLSLPLKTCFIVVTF